MNQDFKYLIGTYLTKGQEILAKISESEVANLIDAIEEVRAAKKVVYIAGNGGSASTASHFATDIGVGSLRRANPVRVVSLCDNLATITAISNDNGFENVFSDQLRILAQPGDLLIVITASGNSQNLVNAVSTANEIGITSFSITGFDGGKIIELTSGRNIHVETPISAYGLVEDAHLAICHVITECIRSIK